MSNTRYKLLQLNLRHNMATTTPSFRSTNEEKQDGTRKPGTHDSPTTRPKWAVGEWYITNSDVFKTEWAATPYTTKFNYFNFQDKQVTRWTQIVEWFDEILHQSTTMLAPTRNIKDKNGYHKQFQFYVRCYLNQLFLAQRDMYRYTLKHPDASVEQLKTQENKNQQDFNNILRTQMNMQLQKGLSGIEPFDATTAFYTAYDPITGLKNELFQIKQTMTENITTPTPTINSEQLSKEKVVSLTTKFNKGEISTDTLCQNLFQLMNEISPIAHSSNEHIIKDPTQDTTLNSTQASADQSMLKVVMDQFSKMVERQDKLFTQQQKLLQDQSHQLYQQQQKLQKDQNESMLAFYEAKSNQHQHDWKERESWKEERQDLKSFTKKLEKLDNKQEAHEWIKALNVWILQRDKTPQWDENKVVREIIKNCFGGKAEALINYKLCEKGIKSIQDIIKFVKEEWELNTWHIDLEKEINHWKPETTLKYTKYIRAFKLKLEEYKMATLAAFGVDKTDTKWNEEAKLKLIMRVLPVSVINIIKHRERSNAMYLQIHLKKDAVTAVLEAQIKSLKELENTLEAISVEDLRAKELDTVGGFDDPTTTNTQINQFQVQKREKFTGITDQSHIHNQNYRGQRNNQNIKRGYQQQQSVPKLKDKYSDEIITKYDNTGRLRKAPKFKPWYCRKCNKLFSCKLQ